MTTNPSGKYTVVICHGEKTKHALFEILQRINCTIREVSTIGDLLRYIKHSPVTFLQFSEPLQENILYKQLLRAIEKGSTESSPGTDITKKSHGTSRADTPQVVVYKSNRITLSEMEGLHIVVTLSRCGWIYSITAKQLGIDRTTLYRKLKKYGIVRDK